MTHGACSIPSLGGRATQPRRLKMACPPPPQPERARRPQAWSGSSSLSPLAEEGILRMILKIPGAASRPAASSLHFQNNCLVEVWSASEEGSYPRLIDCRVTQL